MTHVLVLVQVAQKYDDDEVKYARVWITVSSLHCTDMVLFTCEIHHQVMSYTGKIFTIKTTTYQNMVQADRNFNHTLYIDHQNRHFNQW